MPRRRRRSAWPWVALGVGVGVGVGVTMGVVWLTRRHDPTLVASNPEIWPAPDEEIDDDIMAAGISVVDGRLVIRDLDAWRAFGRDAIEDCLRRGTRNANDLLAYVMRMALPRLPWPPPPGSTLLPQWLEMLGDVNEIIRFDPEPFPRKGLTLIR